MTEWCNNSTFMFTSCVSLISSHVWFLNHIPNMFIPDSVISLSVILLFCLAGILSIPFNGSNTTVRWSDGFPLSLSGSMGGKYFGSWYHFCKSVIILSSIVLLEGFLWLILVGFLTTLARFALSLSVGPNFNSFVSPASIQWKLWPYLALSVFYTMARWSTKAVFFFLPGFTYSAPRTILIITFFLVDCFGVRRAQTISTPHGMLILVFVRFSIVFFYY